MKNIILYIKNVPTPLFSFIFSGFITFHAQINNETSEISKLGFYVKLSCEKFRMLSKNLSHWNSWKPGNHRYSDNRPFIKRKTIWTRNCLTWSISAQITTDRIVRPPKPQNPRIGQDDPVENRLPETVNGVTICAYRSVSCCELRKRHILHRFIFVLLH